MRSCLVGLTLVATCVTAHDASGQQVRSDSLVWSIGLSRGITQRLSDGLSGGTLGSSHNDQSASLLFEWRRPTNRLGVRLELLRGIRDNTLRVTNQPGCDPVSCYWQSDQTTLAALIGATYEFRQGRRLRPYLLFGGGLQSTELRSRATVTCADPPFQSCSGIEGAPLEYNVRDLHAVVTGGGGLSLNLGRFSAFVEGRWIVRPSESNLYVSNTPFSLGLRIRPDN